MIRIKRTVLCLLIIFGLIMTGFIGCGQGSSSDDELVFSGLVELGTTPGERLPGTDIEVIAISEETVEMRIDGQTAHKKTGDSVDWHGPLDPNVDLDLALRVLWFTEDVAQTGGTAKLTIKDANPRPATVQGTSDVQYALPVTFTVRKGKTIPGTLIEYLGKDVEKGAEFAGIEGYPFRKVADSLLWEGALRDNVWLSMELRVILFTDNTLQVGGVAHIWVDQ